MSKLTYIILPLFLSNIIPLVGVLALGWDIYLIIYLYAVELWITLFFAFISYMIAFKKKCKRSGEFMLMFVVLLIMVLCMSIAWIALPLDYISKNSSKDSIVHDSGHASPIQRLMQVVNPYTITAIFFFIASGLIELNISQKEPDYGFRKIWARLMIGIGTVFLILLLAQFMKVNFGLPDSIVSIFILLKVLSGYYLFYWMEYLKNLLTEGRFI